MTHRVASKSDDDRQENGTRQAAPDQTVILNLDERDAVLPVRCIRTLSINKIMRVSGPCKRAHLSSSNRWMYFNAKRCATCWRVRKGIVGKTRQDDSRC